MDLIGTSVRLRGLVEDDAQEISRLVSHPRVGRYVGEWAWLPNSPATAKQFIERVHTGEHWSSINHLPHRSVGLHKVDCPCTLP